MKMKLLRIFLGIIGIITFTWFAIPLSLSVNLNIGNITGLAVAVLILVYAILMPCIHKIFTEWKMHPTKKWLCRAILSILFLIVGLVIIESTCMIQAACKTPPSDSTVVVLGCRVYGERASLSLQERLSAAYNYLSEHENVVCIVSGGQGEGEDISEAECMYRYLVDLGIDASRIYKEDQSTTTRENLAFSKQIIEENGLNPTIAIATSEYHEYRAGKIAESLDIEYAAVPAKTAIWLFPTYYVRELYAILYERVF